MSRYVKIGTMDSREIRRRYIEFFKKKDHQVIPSTSLVPENDPSVLFITAGMQPLMPYLLGEKHPLGERLVGVQKCLRTQDIDEVGDATHLTFFEMLGNWSLGNYFKKEAIEWSYQFITEELKLDPSCLYITVFEGDDNAPRDEESFAIWKGLGIPENRIYFKGTDSNWWSPGANGPCGPDTEMFWGKVGDLSREEFIKAEKEEKVVEIWNDVFMEYEKKEGRVVGKLAKQNVDTGAGLERMAMAVQGKSSVFETDLFKPILDLLPANLNLAEKRIVADHAKASVFLLADGVRPSNKDQGYVLRRLLRRMINLNVSDIYTPLGKVIELYGDTYQFNKEEIFLVVKEEETKFRETLARGQMKIDKLERIDAKTAFDLFQSEGLPFETVKDLAGQKAKGLKREDFDVEFAKHQEISRAGADQKFKGGLADHGEMSVKYHTATHLLHQALREVLGDQVEQKGSNINEERLRFDFSHSQKMTEEEKQKVEDIVNEKIEEGLEVTFEDLPLAEAKKRGAQGVFGDKYGEKVKVYKIGDFSLEICGGPHVDNIEKLGKFKIVKEEAVSQGVRRIRAKLD
jgi:alanyl-tRNA synthetase